MTHAQAERERRQQELKDRFPNRAKAAAANTRRATLGASGGSRDGLKYRFTRGESFGYRINIVVRYEGSPHVERLEGSPYIVVKSVDTQGEGAAELFAIGKLQCITRRAADMPEKIHPNRAVWLGSKITLDPSGQLSGSADVNSEVLPDYFRTLKLELKRLIFPELPRAVPSVDDSRGNASLFVSSSGGSLAGAGFGVLDGKASTVKHAELMGGTSVRLTHGVAFQTNASVQPRVKITYRAIGELDRDNGRLRQFDSTFRQEKGSDMPVVATVRVRLLEGSALRKAYSQAVADWEERPGSLEP
jgi:hypothetical protein